MRSEEWRKGRTVHIAPQSPFFIIVRVAEYKTWRHFIIVLRRTFTPHSSFLTPNLEIYAFCLN